MPRLFTGLELPPDLAVGLELMKGGIPGARWIDTDAFHITLRFVGDVSDDIADDLDRELSGLRLDPFELRLKGAGYFGGTKPRTLFMKVAASDALERLHNAHERTCQIIGLQPEARNFTPHVTLARLKNPPLDALNDFVSRQSMYASRAFEVTRFVLFSARPGRGGGPYVHERTYDLERTI
ncbi:MAG: RNA 2',3'-cyclic phosphodiesterase [Hyphomicrobiales bacterium]|nr:RNA 2',3'-cyclic phosphodiesterase [Hyphomicrobiales bacterium]